MPASLPQVHQRVAAVEHGVGGGAEVLGQVVGLPAVPDGDHQQHQPQQRADRKRRGQRRPPPRARGGHGQDQSDRQRQARRQHVGHRVSFLSPVIMPKGGAARRTGDAAMRSSGQSCDQGRLGSSFKDKHASVASERR
ncbi:hypothetical protein Acsp04_17100 [Actinomadura sp. NBRC 104425]|nr:hypothetical protein Acsp04_17100 [Actinomadura sp. NBRC 104425]